MTLNYCVNDILKPFQSVLGALATRQAARERFTATYVREAACVTEKSPVKVQAIRRRTTRQFHFWDRLKETIKSPDTLCSEMQNFADTLVTQAKACNDQLTASKPPSEEATLDQVQLAKNRSALARAKTTNSRLRSLEEYLENNKS